MAKSNATDAPSKVSAEKVPVTVHQTELDAKDSQIAEIRSKSEHLEDF